MNRTRNLEKLDLIFSMLVWGLLSIFLNTLIHEGGHALTALFFGGEVTRFDINFITSNPRVSFRGEFSPLQGALIDIAGPLLPWLFWLLLLPFALRLKPFQSFQARIGFLIHTMGVLGSLLPQVAIPLIHVLSPDTNLRSEDIYKFMTKTGISPWVISLFFLSLLIGSLWVLRRINLLGFIRWLRSPHGHSVKPSQLALKLTAMVLIIGLVILLPTQRGLLAPASYDTHLQVPFSQLEYDLTTVYTISLLEPRVYDFIYSLSTRSSVHLRLISEDSEFLYSNSNTLSLYNGAESLPQAFFTGFLLQPGQYRLEVETQDRRGDLSMYITGREPGPEQIAMMELMQSLKVGHFDPEFLLQEGYALIHHGPIRQGEDQLLSTWSPKGPFLVSAFILGETSSFELFYRDGRETISLLSNTSLTMGRGVQPKASQGEFRLTSTGGTGELILYIKDL